MTTDTFVEDLSTLIADPLVAGIAIRTTYRSPMPTLAPPAGTLRAGGTGGRPVVDVHGEFDLPTGGQGVIIDSVGSQASRMEAAAEDLAEQLGYPLVRFLDTDNTMLTTSARLSHRHADATWRATFAELTAAGIPFEEIQKATPHTAQPLLTWFPTALLMGWWHSQTVITDPKKAKDADKARRAALRDEQIAEALSGYAPMGPNMRSARLMTSEIIATGVHRRQRMPAKVDSLLGPLSKTEDKGPSAYGLGSLPPVQEAKAVIDVTYEDIHGSWWLSLAGLRQIGGLDDPDTGRVLLACLALLLREHAQRSTRLRSGTELIAQDTTIEVWRHSAQPQTIQIPDHDTLIDIVRTLGAKAGWTGPRDITITPDSVLGRVITLAASAADVAAATEGTDA